jgi:undecaprenyl-diphosphatase
LYQLVSAREELFASQGQVLNLVVALLVSAAVGYATIPWLLGFLRTHSTFVFIVYRLVLAAVIVGLIASGELDAVDAKWQQGIDATANPAMAPALEGNR